MGGGNGFGLWLIDLATGNPPPGREDWARAMRAEFEALERGRGQWALGCLGAAVGWRLKADLVFYLAMAGITVWLLEIQPWVEFLVGSWFPRESYMAFMQVSAYALTWGAIALACMALAALRPRYWIFAGLAFPVIFDVVSLIQFILIFHQPIASIPTIHMMDARWDVGLGALIGYGLIGAMIGRGLRGARSGAGEDRRPA